MELYDTQWQESNQVGPQPAQHLCGLAVGSEPLVKVINLCNGPIRLQFRRLMTARCVTARAGPAAGWVVAFMYGDERKTSRLSLAMSAITRKMTYFFKKCCDHFHLSVKKDFVHIILIIHTISVFPPYSSKNHLNFVQCNIDSIRHIVL